MDAAKVAHKNANMHEYVQPFFFIVVSCNVTFSQSLPLYLITSNDMNDDHQISRSNEPTGPLEGH